jgi:hypothetical protein
MWMVVFFTAVLVSLISWGDSSSFMHVGTYNNLDVQANFMGYTSVEPNGEFVFQIGQPMLYQVRVTNRGNRSVPQIEVYSSLHTDGVSCGDETVNPGARLEGNSLSPTHRFSLAPGQSYEYDAMYDPPAGLCAGSSHLQVRLSTIIRDIQRATTLYSPAHFHFE